MKKDCACVVIPTSKLSGIDIQNEFGSIPPCMIPVLGEIAIDRIIRAYESNQVIKFRFILGVHENKKSIEEYFKFFPREDVELIDVGNTNTLGETILTLVTASLQYSSSPIIVNLGDTINDDIPYDLHGRDFVACATTEESERWTRFNLVGTKIARIDDKVFAIDNTGSLAFTGIWGISSPNTLIEMMKRVESASEDLFMSAIAEYYNSRKTEFFRSLRWMDLGHVDNYYDARGKYIRTGFFNSINISKNSSTLIKRSKNAQKLIEEINWYLNIPDSLKFFIPRILDYSIQSQEPWIEMELYSYPSLDDCFVGGRFDLDVWKKAIDRVFFFITEGIG